MIEEESKYAEVRDARGFIAKKDEKWGGFANEFMGQKRETFIQRRQPTNEQGKFSSIFARSDDGSELVHFDPQSGIFFPQPANFRLGRAGTVRRRITARSTVTIVITRARTIVFTRPRHFFVLILTTMRDFWKASGVNVRHRGSFRRSNDRGWAGLSSAFNLSNTNLSLFWTH